MLTTLRFERIQERHIPHILAIESRTNTAPWSERSFQNELTHERSIFFTVFLGGEVIGYGGIWLVVDEAHITTIAIAPEHQRQGIGEKLLTELLVKAREAGMMCSTLEVRASNDPAIRLYEKLGFVVAARRKAYYPDNKEDAIVMWLYDLVNWTPPRP